MTDRIQPAILPQITAVIDALNGYLAGVPGLTWRTHHWQRPKAGDERFDSPPYALVRPFPSAGEFDGPLSEGQADTVLRIQLLGVGEIEQQAIAVTDICRAGMKKSLVNAQLTGRRVMDLRLMTVHGGARRDDDLQTPFFYSTDLYELHTTPE